MTGRTVLVACLLLIAALAVGPAVTPAAATHSCVDDMPCYPHVDPPHPKELLDVVRCLILAQPPTACI